MKPQYSIIFTVTCLLAGLAFYFLSRSRTFQLFGNIVSRIPTKAKVVALTFDDGPATNTDSILHILELHNVKATFFLTGQEIARHPTLTRKFIQQGHCVGNHSYSHQRMVLKGRRFIQEEIETTDDLIKAAGYQNEIYFRPPYGKKLLYLPYYLNKKHRTTITWDVEPDSDNNADSAAIVQNVIKNVKPGSIILLHAMYKNRSASLQALPSIIKWLKNNGYTLVTLDAPGITLKK